MWCMRISKWRFSSLALYSTPLPSPFSEDERSLLDRCLDCRSIKRTFYVEEIRDRVYAVTFTPQARGKHRVFVYLNGMEVGSKITFH